MTKLEDLLKTRILLMDGGMGTMIQSYNLSEDDYRGVRFANCDFLQKGNHDLLSLTQAEIIYNIHEQYLEAGADIIKTNTFNAQRVSMSKYGMENRVYELNMAAAQLAVRAAQKYATIQKPRFVAGSIGPTHRMVSILPEKKIFQNIDKDTLKSAYIEQICGLMDGGCDILLVETVFDVQNANACLSAMDEVFKHKNRTLPVMISANIDDSGRLLSGQTLEDFLMAVSHFPLLSVGINCFTDIEQMIPHVKLLSEKAPFYISIHPNAGSPNSCGEYQETAEKMVESLKKYIELKFVNIVGGCCGTTPEHIHQIASLVGYYIPRKMKNDELYNFSVAPQNNLQ